MASQGIEKTGREIEGKWLDPVGWHDRAIRLQRIQQGYLALDPNGNSTRLRYISGVGASLATKGKPTSPGNKPEADDPVSDQLYLAHWPFTEGRRIKKTRYIVPMIGCLLLGEVIDLIAEVDVFESLPEGGASLEGLVMVEVEVPSPEHLADLRANKPDWFGDDVTEDPRYSNVSLAVNGMPTR